MGCSDNSQTRGATAVFDTQSEAEKAAKNFNCVGAHKMGKVWMPCKSHAVHEEEEKHEKFGSNHHH